MDPLFLPVSTTDKTAIVRALVKKNPLFFLQKPSEAKMWAAKEDAYVSAGSLSFPLSLYFSVNTFFSRGGHTLDSPFIQPQSFKLT